MTRVALLVFAFVSCKKPPSLHGTLQIVAAGRAPGTLDLGNAHLPVEEVGGYDPYYNKEKRFSAVPMGALLARAFDGVAASEEEYLVRARDGYAVALSGERLRQGAYLAFADLEVPGFEPIGPARVNPGPLYLVWGRKGQEDLTEYPRPWQVVALERATLETLYPLTVPEGGSKGPRGPGFALFLKHCVRCHAINRQGGRVGPDLNVPKNITEYRSLADIRAYIVNPSQFRYGNMPSHEHLNQSALDDLIAYLQSMKDHKHDPAGLGEKGGHSGGK